MKSEDEPEVIWDYPPPLRREDPRLGKFGWCSSLLRASILAARTKPGRWAAVPCVSSTAAYRYATSARLMLEPLGYEIASAKRRVYIRWRRPDFEVSEIAERAEQRRGSGK